MTVVDALAPLPGDDFVAPGIRVSRLGAGATLPDAAHTPHFDVALTGSTVVVGHRITPAQLDNDITGLLTDELFTPGLVTGERLFQQVFTGIVRTTVRDPLLAWSTFYANSLAKIRAAWRASQSGQTTLAGMAPVYERAIELTSPSTVLDIGSCFGFFPLLLADAGYQVTASDIDPGTIGLLSRMAEQRRVDLATLVCDATSVPLPADAVDTVTVLHLLEHLPPALGKMVVAEALRVARRSVVIAVPFEEQPDPTFGHIRRFDPATLRELGGETGAHFTVDEHHGGWLVLQP